MGLFDIFKKRKIEILAPANGELISISQVNDPAFAQGMLGPGVAIKPIDGVVKAPVSGEVTVVFPTGHAFAMKTDEGVEILIHVGLDTVELCGEGFENKVNVGDRVTKGQTVIIFKIEEISQKGYDTTIPMVIMNSDEFGNVKTIEPKAVICGDVVMEIVN